MTPFKMRALGASLPPTAAAYPAFSPDDFPRLPATGFVRLPKILELIPVSETTWWDGVREGRYPPPVKLSARCSAWPVASIQRLIEQLSAPNCRN